MLVAILPFLICVVGLIVYLIASKPEAKELGRIAFACGLLVLTYVLAGYTVRVG